jgi:hypothetical protein
MSLSMSISLVMTVDFPTWRHFSLCCGWRLRGGQRGCCCHLSTERNSCDQLPHPTPGLLVTDLLSLKFTLYISTLIVSQGQCRCGSHGQCRLCVYTFLVVVYYESIKREAKIHWPIKSAHIGRFRLSLEYSRTRPGFTFHEGSTIEDTAWNSEKKNFSHARNLNGRLVPGLKSNRR